MIHTSTNPQTDVRDRSQAGHYTTSILELLIQKLIQGARVDVVTPALADVLYEIVTRLISQLGGPHRQSATEFISHFEPVFADAARALSVILDADDDLSLLGRRGAHFRQQFEHQLLHVATLFAAGRRGTELNYFHRIQLKDALHQLLETIQVIRQVRADVSP